MIVDKEKTIMPLNDGRKLAVAAAVASCKSARDINKNNKKLAGTVARPSFAPNPGATPATATYPRP
jgi:hypothetical protein